MQQVSAVLIIYVTATAFVSVHAACNPESCQFGGSCLATALDSTELECVCPSYPRCTPETGGNIVVCGDDGVTYSSFCEMRDALCAEQKWISLRHEGPCGDDVCTTEWDCLYLGRCVGGKCVCEECRDVIDRRVYYKSEAERQAANAALKRTSVCGSDGVTYESECHLNYHACMSKTLLVVDKRGVCDHDKYEFVLRSVDQTPSFKVIERQIVEAPRPINCTTVTFKQCVSKRYERLKYMGTFVRQNSTLHLNSSVYRLTKYGYVGSFTSAGEVDEVYLSRHTTKRHPKGIWIVGSEIGSGKGWLGVSDAAALPENIQNMWRVTEMRRNAERWVDAPSLSLQCQEEENFECLDSIAFDGDEESNWLLTVPPTPLYVLNVIKPRRGKFRNEGKIVYQKQDLIVFEDMLIDFKSLSPEVFMTMQITIHHVPFWVDAEECPELIEV